MNFDGTEKCIRVDLLKENFDLEEALQFSEATSIRFDNIDDNFFFEQKWLGLSQLPELKSLRLYPSGKGKLVSIPSNIDQFKFFSQLTLWSNFDLSGLVRLDHIESLDVVITEPLIDIKVISQFFPNLKKMQIWGKQNKQGIFPSEIGSFDKLQELSLMSCGLSSLPPEFANLKRLRQLEVKGNFFDEFPLQICDLTQLEELCFLAKLNKLPDEFSKLKKLRKLDFSNTFNGGTMNVVNKWSEKKVYLKPIPEVIGELIQLEELNLDCCGVVELRILKKLQNLKKFYCSYSGIEDCRDFSHLSQLKILSIPKGKGLKTLDGLQGLNIEELHINSCYDLESLDIVLELKKLKKISIDNLEEVYDFEPIYENPTIEVLSADESIEKQWQVRKKFKALPPIQQVISELSSTRFEVFYKSLENLSLYVERNYQRGKNPLAGYFAVKTTQPEPTRLPYLEDGFLLFLNHFTTDQLLQLIKLTLKDVGDDNFQITIFALKELVHRGDENAELEFLKIFTAACKYYDPGHRYWETSVLDQIYDEILPSFGSKAIVQFLKSANTDVLNRNGGDGADSLFAIGFKKSRETNLTQNLLDLFFKYQDSSVEHFGFDYFNTLHKEIEVVLTDSSLNEFKNLVEQRNKIIELLKLLESKAMSDFIVLVHQMEPHNLNFFKNNYYKILDRAMSFPDLPNEIVKMLLQISIQLKIGPPKLVEVILWAFSGQGPHDVFKYIDSFNQLQDEYVKQLVLNIIYVLHKRAQPEQLIESYRHYLIGKFSTNRDELLNLELSQLFLLVTKNNDRASVSIEMVLNQIEKISSEVKQVINLTNCDFAFNLKLMADGASEVDWKSIKKIAKSLFPKMNPKSVEKVLHLAIVAAVKTKDREFLQWSEDLMPEEISQNLIPYNLACAFALWSEKSKMLKFVRQAIKMGKVPEQFLDDEDFSEYKTDKDFLRALNES